MDTRTGELVTLSPEEARIADGQWLAYMSGAMAEKPRYQPIEKDFKPQLTAKQRKRLKIKSYKDFCR